MFGTSGTLIGTGVGAVVSGAAAELYGRMAAAAKARLPRPELSGRLVGELAVGAVVVAVAAFGVVFGVEKVAGRPLSAVTTGSDQRGSSFTGVAPYTPPPDTAAVVTPSPSPSSSPSFSVSPPETGSTSPATASPSATEDQVSPPGDTAAPPSPSQVPAQEPPVSPPVITSSP